MSFLHGMTVHILASSVYSYLTGMKVNEIPACKSEVADEEAKGFIEQVVFLLLSNFIKY